MPFPRFIFKDRSLWYKLTLVSLLPAIIATPLIANRVMGAMERVMLGEAATKAEALTDFAQLSIAQSYIIYNKNLLDHLVDGLAGLPGITYAMVVDSHDQRVLAHNDHRLDGTKVDLAVKAGAGAPPPSVSDGGAITDDYRTLAPILIENNPYGYLNIGFSFAQVHQQIVSFKRRIWAVALLAMALGVGLALLMAKLISVPIHGLARQAKLADDGHLDQPLVYDSKDALGQLAGAFNRMLTSFNVKQEQLRAINTIADAVYHSLDMPTMARHAVTAMMGYSHSPAVALFALDEASRQLKMVHAKGFDPQTTEKASSLPMEGSLTGLAVRKKQVVTTADLPGDDRLVPEVRKALAAESLNSVVSIPLLAQDRVLGAMNLIYKTRYQITDSEKETLLSIGKTIGLALANARQMALLQREVEERKEAEEALRSSENKYRNLVERANDGIVIIQDGMIRFANPSAIRLSGQPADQFINQPYTAYLHPAEVTKINKLYTRRMAEEAPAAIYETVFVRKDGKPIYAEVNAGLTIYQDKPADLVFIRDITDRKRAQEALRQAYDQLEIKVAERTAELAVAKERAEESDRLKSAFLAAMSHELRTPLNSIIGFTGIILQNLVGPLNPEQTKQLTMVQDSANHLLSLINDVLDLSKIEAGQLTVASEVFDMREAVEKVTRTVSPLARQKSLTLRVDLGPGVGTITSDRRRVEQILLNLVNNAIKFTPQGEVTISCEADPQRIITTVRDTGIGIAPEDSDKLFRAFQQIETGLSRRFEGTGLGLSICRKLVELLGGQIRAHSEGPGRGSTFTFTLPTGEKP